MSLKVFHGEPTTARAARTGTDETGCGTADAAPSMEPVEDLPHRLDQAPPAKQQDMVFQSANMQRMVEQALRFARSSATVLLTGASGTGKEVLAQLIHNHSPRARQRYVRVNCAALPEMLMESELFGHERGAFTGAVERRIGKFEWACGGTLLLDEISEMPVNIQAKLLRVLEQEEFQRLGDNETHRTDVRVIATSNRELQQDVRKGVFRADLYHRLNVLQIRLPPLRECREDIPLLVDRFVAWFRKEAMVPVRGVSDQAMELLMHYSWPGNVRQLRNAIHRACVLTTSEWIQIQDLPPLTEEQDSLPAQWLSCTLHEIERQVILKTIDRCGGNKTAAARHLGVTPRTLSNKLKAYGLQKAA